MLILFFLLGEKKKIVSVVKECLQIIFVYECIGGGVLVDYLFVL